MLNYVFRVKALNSLLYFEGCQIVSKHVILCQFVSNCVKISIDLQLIQASPQESNPKHKQQFLRKNIDTTKLALAFPGLAGNVFQEFAEDYGDLREIMGDFKRFWDATCRQIKTQIRKSTQDKP